MAQNDSVVPGLTSIKNMQGNRIIMASLSPHPSVLAYALPKACLGMDEKPTAQLDEQRSLRGPGMIYKEQSYSGA